MFRVKSCLFLITVILSHCFVFADAKVLTTNDVDAVFQGMEIIPRPPFWNRCKDSGLMDKTIPQPEIRRYALDRLLALTVSTNTPRFVAVMRSNADYITRSEFLFGMKLCEFELRKILQNVQRYHMLSTNSLKESGDLAVELYKKKYGRKPYYAGLGLRREFIDEWTWHRYRVLNWNKEVAEYRRKLIEFVCHKYHAIHADVPDKERVESLTRLLGEYGFSLPEIDHSIPPSTEETGIIIEVTN